MICTFNQYLSDDNTKLVVEKPELQNTLDSMSKHDKMILSEVYNYSYIEDINILNEEDVQNLGEIVNRYFSSTLEDVIKEIKTLDADELDEFGFFLSTTFFDFDDDDDSDFPLEDVIEMATSLSKETHFIGYLMDALINGFDDYGEMTEGVSRIMRNSNMNRKKRKYMSKSASALRREKSTRRRAAVKGKAKKKRYYKANKTKISSYQKSRSGAIKKGKHMVKKRKQS